MFQQEVNILKPLNLTLLLTYLFFKNCTKYIKVTYIETQWKNIHLDI